MPYRFAKRETVADGVRRIALEQVDRAIGELDDPALDRDRTIFRGRSHCRKIRGLLRLVRPALGRTYRVENAWYRDAARLLSQARDAEVALRTFDTLMRPYAGVVNTVAFNRIRGNLVKRRDRFAPGRFDVDARLRAFEAALREGRERVGAWRLEADGFDAVRDGLERSYGRGRRAMKVALQRQRDDDFHEWRKDVKIHRYHVRLFSGVWKPVLGARLEGLQDLCDVLGEDHDLAVLKDALIQEARNVPGRPETEIVRGLLEQRRRVNRSRIGPLAECLYAGKPSRLGRRLERRWNRWWEGAPSVQDGSGKILRFGIAVSSGAGTRPKSPDTGKR